MLSEACAVALVDSITRQALVFQGKTLTPRVIRDKEFINFDEAKVDKSPSVVVAFPKTTTANRTISDLMAVDSNGVPIFGTQERTEVEIRISAKELRKGDEIMHAAELTRAILGNIDNLIKRTWNVILATYNGSIDIGKPFSYNDLTKFVQADNRSIREMRFFIEHDSSWNVSESGPAGTLMIRFKIDGDEDYTIVQEV